MKKYLALILALAMTVCLVAGCNGNTNPTAAPTDAPTDAPSPTQGEQTEAPTGNGEKKDLVVGYACSNLTEEYFQALSGALEEVVTAYGGTYNAYDGSTGASTQVTQIEDMIANGVNVLVVTPLDSTAMAGVLQQAKEAGILIVNVDAQVMPEDEQYVDCIIVSDNYMCGVLIGEDMIERFGDQEVECMFDTVPTNEAISTRFQGIYDTLKGHDNFIINDIPLKDGFAGLPNHVEDLLQGHPNTTVFVGLNDTAGMSMHATAKAAGIDPISYGIDGSPAGKKAISTGDLTCTIAQSALGLGKTAGENVIALFEGKTVEKHQSVPVVKIDATNIDQYDLDGWQ